MNSADFIAKALSIARTIRPRIFGAASARRSPTRASPGRRTPTQRIQKRGGLTPLAATPETPRRFISIAWASLRRSCGGGAGIAPEPTAAPPIRP